MLVPRTPLLLWVGFLALPCAILGGTVPGALGPAVAVLAIFVAAVALDALRVRGGLGGIAVQMPELIRFQKDRPGSLEVRISNAPKTARTVRLGFAFPLEIASADQDRLLSLPAGTLTSRIEWPCTPSRRGQYWLEAVYLEAASPLGLWAARGRQPLRCELRVYPNLFEERKNVAALFLRRGRQGVHAQRQAGQGREFEKLREYLHGDSIEDVHWKASARRGHLVTKIFQVERTQEVYVIVDASRLTARTVEVEGQVPGSMLERFVTASLILGLAAEQQGDQFGLLTFSDRVLGFVRARNGQAHYNACRDRLYSLQPQAVTPDYEELFSFIRLKLRKRALLIFLTALDDPMLAEGFAKSVQLISRQHLVLVNMLQPPGAVPLFSEPAAQIDDLYRHLGGHLQWQQLRELQKVLQRRGVRLSLLNPGRLSAEIVAQHADVKARQLV